jgi:hypothetical protein
MIGHPPPHLAANATRSSSRGNLRTAPPPPQRRIRDTGRISANSKSLSPRCDQFLKLCKVRFAPVERREDAGQVMLHRRSLLRATARGSAAAGVG